MRLKLLVAVQQAVLPRIGSGKLARPTNSILHELARLGGGAALEVLVDVDHVDEHELRQLLVADDDDAVLVIAVARLGTEVVGTKDHNRLVTPRVDHDDLAVSNGVSIRQLEQLFDEVGKVLLIARCQSEQRLTTLATLGFDTDERVVGADSHELVQLRIAVPDVGHPLDHRRVARVKHLTDKDVLRTLHQRLHSRQERRERNRRILGLDLAVHARLEVSLDDRSIRKGNWCVTLGVALAERERLLAVVRQEPVPVVHDVRCRLSVANASHHVRLATHTRVRPVGATGCDVRRHLVLVALDLELVVRNAPSADHAIVNVRLVVMQRLAGGSIGQVVGAGVAQDEREVLEVLPQEVHQLVRAQLVNSLIHVSTIAGALRDRSHEHCRNVRHQLLADDVVGVGVVVQGVDELLEVGLTVRTDPDHVGKPLSRENAASESNFEGFVDLGGKRDRIGGDEQTLDGSQFGGCTVQGLNLIGVCLARLAGKVDPPLALNRPNRARLALPVLVVLAVERQLGRDDLAITFCVDPGEGETERIGDLDASVPIPPNEGHRVVVVSSGDQFDCLRSHSRFPFVPINRLLVKKKPQLTALLG